MSALVCYPVSARSVFRAAPASNIVLTMTVSGALAFFFLSEVRTGAVAPGPTWKSPLIGFYVVTGLSLRAKGLIVL